MKASRAMFGCLIACPAPLPVHHRSRPPLTCLLRLLPCRGFYPRSLSSRPSLCLPGCLLRYKGRTFAQIANDPEARGFIDWCLKLTSPGGQLKVRMCHVLRVERYRQTSVVLKRADWGHLTRLHQLRLGTHTHRCGSLYTCVLATTGVPPPPHWWSAALTASLI